MLTRQVFVIAWAVAMYAMSQANRDANRLFEDLLADYNKLVRPVDNNSDTLVVRFKLKLSQLLDVVSSHLARRGSRSGEPTASAPPLGGGACWRDVTAPQICQSPG